MGQSTLLQLVKVDFQWCDVCVSLCGLLQVHNGLHCHFHLRGLEGLTILNTNSQKKSMLKTPQVKLTTSQFLVRLLTKNQLFGSCAVSDLQAIRLFLNFKSIKCSKSGKEKTWNPDTWNFPGVRNRTWCPFKPWEQKINKSCMQVCMPNETLDKLHSFFISFIYNMLIFLLFFRQGNQLEMG